MLPSSNSFLCKYHKIIFSFHVYIYIYSEYYTTSVASNTASIPTLPLFYLLYNYSDLCFYTSRNKNFFYLFIYSIHKPTRCAHNK